jgi:GH24 family phage-related lysozyme (muramidase)
MATQTSLDFSIVGSVAAWQHILNGCGYQPKLRITGKMDENTVQTTQRFQKDVGLTVTGEVDLATWQAGLKHEKLIDWPELPIPPVESELNTTIIGKVPHCAIAIIKEFEGYGEELNDGTNRVKAYPDPIKRWTVPTIGYGTTYYSDGRKVEKGDVITKEEAEEYLMWEVVKKCKPQLEMIPTWKQMNSNQRGALYSFAYNLGAGFYRGSKFASITQVCDSPELWTDKNWITEQFIKYRNPGSPAEEGLRRRRIAEAKLFCTPVSD